MVVRKLKLSRLYTKRNAPELERRAVQFGSPHALKSNYSYAGSSSDATGTIHDALNMLEYRFKEIENSRSVVQ
jgi:hypothetical protein